MKKSELKGFDELEKTEFEKALQRYDELFESFPTIPLLNTHSEEWILDVIEKCIAEGKDVYEMGIIKELTLEEII